MSKENQDNSQKTEEPTARQLEEARKEGRIPISREIVSFAIFLASTLLIYFALKPLSAQFFALASGYIISPHAIAVDSLNIKMIAGDVILILLLAVFAPLLINAIAVLLSHLVQHGGFVFSTKSLSLDLSKISIIKGLQRLFSLRSLIELLKSVLKIILVGTAAYLAVKSQLRDMEAAFYLHFREIADLAIQIIMKMMLTVCSIMFLIGIVDFIYQRFEHIKGLRMSVQDIKDEQKTTEGNPEIKARQRSKRRELIKRFNINDVIKADVIITNPTHYAVALEYDPQAMHAPKIAAKGSDLIALEIRRVATEHFIPIVRNPQLARALFDTAEAGDFIPLEHYKAVAEVISYIMSINKNSRIASFARKKSKS